MCGIYGFFSKSEKVKFGLSQMENMAKLLHHRGPDGKGIYCLNNVAGIGNVRLSILDPEAGGQPFYSKDHNIVLVQNGEIFNFREIKEELIQKGVSFDTNCDTEVLLKLYLEKGIDFLHQLNGMFAIAIYHVYENKLILARDRIGEKPLYVANSLDCLYFASEMKSLLPYVDKSIDLNALNAFLQLNYIPCPLTGYTHIRHLKPGHYMEIEKGKVTTTEWWDLSTQKINISTSEEQWKTEFTALFKDAVQKRLVSDVPFGAFLSGGVDSSSVVGVMSNLMDEPVRTYTIGFPDKRFDESIYAQEASELFGTNHTVKEVSYDIVEEWSDFIYHCDKPHGDVSFMPMRKVASLAAKDVKMVLTGDGADELFAGYDKYERLFNRREISQKNSLLEDILVEFTLMGPELISSLWKPEFVSQINHSEVYNLFEHDLARVEHFDDINKVLYLDMKYLLPGNNLVKPDRMAMAESLETRAPFLDYRLMEFSFKTPGHFKLNKGDKKYLLKKAVAPMIGENLAYRKKQMFTMPIGEWFKDELSSFCQDLLLSQNSRINKFFNKTVVEELIKKHISESANYTREIRALISIELWLRRFH